MIKKFNISDVTGSHVVGDRAPKYVLATVCTAIEDRLASIDKKFMVLQGSHDLLVKERDEWKRRCEAMAALAGDCDPSLNRYYLVACKCGWKGSSSECNGGTPLADTGDYDDVTCPSCGCVDPADMQARAHAIAVGRDNG